MESDLTQEEFALGVLYVAKRVLGDEARYISKTRAIKLVCLAADEIGFGAISWGWYRFGNYSFRVDNILTQTFKENLLDTEMPKIELPEELKKRLERFINSARGPFVSTRDEFWRWIHYQTAPAVYREFYRSHEKFLKAIDTALHDDPSRYYESVGDAITQYNKSLQHVPQNVLDIFFTFTDLLEDLLLVCKRRGLDRSDEVRSILGKMVELYTTKIYPSLTPFEQSLKGTDREHELRLFRDRRMNFCEEASKELIRIKETMQRSGLMPSLEEIDLEIAERLDKASESEIQKLDSTLRELSSINRISAF